MASFPIQAGAISAGVLTVYSSACGVLCGPRLELAFRLADLALLGVLDVLAGLDEAADSPPDTSVDGGRPNEVADVLRVEVHQAAGMIMVQAGVSIEQALARLRARAFGSDISITDLAGDV